MSPTLEDRLRRELVENAPFVLRALVDEVGEDELEKIELGASMLLELALVAVLIVLNESESSPSVVTVRAWRAAR